jgi:hypothetical protein
MQPSLGSGLFSSTSRALRYSISGCSVLLAIASIVMGIEVSVATASSGAAPSAAIVNRAQKSNRLPLVPALHQNPVNRQLEVNLPLLPAPNKAWLTAVNRWSAHSLVLRWRKSQAAACLR